MQPKLSIDQIAEVFELRNKGVLWDNLGTIFGISTKTLRRYTRLAEEHGFGFWYGAQYTVNENQTSYLKVENDNLKQQLQAQTDMFRDLFDEILTRLIEVENSLDDLRTARHEDNHSRKSTHNKI